MPPSHSLSGVLEHRGQRHAAETELRRARGLARSIQVHSRSGFTAIELMVASCVALVAVSMFAAMTSSLVKQRYINHENAIASQASRNAIEAMRAVEFDEVFATYNQDPADDPDDPGTAPGHRFAVPGLVPRDDSPDGMIGEIFFPTLLVPGPPDTWQVREDVVDEALGMPRDLNGDSMIDGLDHADDYYLMPVRVRLQWAGSTGDREFTTITMICNLQ